MAKIASQLRTIFLGLLICLGDPRLGCAQTADAALEAGHPFVENFAARVYEADNQVWSVTQDEDGILYFGNKGVVLEYDGVTWRKIFINDNSYDIRGLASDPASRTVFVGGLNDLGFLKAEADGSKVFASLLDRLSAADRDFGSVYRVFATREGIFFVATKQVMRWRDGAFTLWKFPVEDRLQSAYCGGSLYVQSPGLGLQRLEGERFVLASQEPIFLTATLAGMGSGPAGSLVIGTRRDGMFVLREEVLTPLTSGLDAFFRDKGGRHLLRLRDGTLAVATGTAGIILLDAEGHFLNHWDEASGLQNQTILDLFEDREGGVWLGTNAGITRVQAGSPLSIFDAPNGLKRASIHRIQRYHGTLYIASDSGLYHLVKADPSLGRAARCERVAGMDADYWGLCATDHGLLIAGLGTLYQFDDDRASLIGKFPYSGALLWPSRRNGRVFLGTRFGLSSLRFDEASQRWFDEGAVPGITAEIHSIVESTEGDVWLGSIDRGLFRVRFAQEESGGQRGAASVTTFLGRSGPLADEVKVRVSLSPDREVMACTRKGLYQFDVAAATFCSPGQYGAFLTDGSFALEDFVPDKQAGFWFTGRSTRIPWLDQQGGWMQKGDPDSRENKSKSLPHQIFDKLTTIDVLAPGEDDGVVWLASPDGIVRLDERRWRQETAPDGFKTLIRRADATARATTSSTAGPVALSPAGTRLDPAHNSVQFEVAADTYAPGADLRYLTRLLGFGGGGWGAPDASTRFEFTNLPAGVYRFEARAQNADSKLGQVAGLDFIIEPAWQRTGWAYVLYTVLAIVFVAAVFRWRLVRLRTANSRLEALVAVRTDELRVHQIELEHAKDRADTTNRAKSAFLANMSHELRTPLNAVLGYTQIMLKDPELSARNRERLTVVGDSGNHLLSMINEVLDISKIEAGKLTLDAVNFALDGLLDEVSATFAPRLADKGLRFEQARDGQRPGVVRGDVGKLRQVLFNLLSNAAKFTGRGEVRFTVEGQEDRWRFEVSDTGMGIEENDLRDLFTAFHQGSAGKQSSQGTGLGLAISQRLVELLGGSLQVESTSGKGSRFWFELPLPQSESSDLSVATERAPRDDRKIRGYQGMPRRLLVADDEPINRHILREMLEPLGFEIEAVENGAQTLDWCARNTFDALLLDLRMEPVDGFEVARTLRRKGGAGRVIKIIAISASVFESDQQQALDAGCDDFLAKPFEEAQLIAVLGRLLMLEWVYASSPAVRANTPVPVENGANPSAGEIDAMLELSRRGDIRGIKKRLDALLANEEGHDYSGFARRIEPMVASYQMDRIRDLLIHCKQNGNGHS